MNITKFFFIFFTFLNLVDSKCTTTNNNNTITKDFHILLMAFNSTQGFNPSFLETDRHSPNNCSSYPNPITEINLSFRNLSGTISWHFLRNLTHLTSLDVSHNALQGYVPSWVWTLRTVRYVNLSHNSFGGSLGFSRVGPRYSSAAQSIDVSHNRFTKLGNLSGCVDLTRLDVSYNNLRALSPGVFGNLTKLDYLDVSNCHLSGNLNPIKNLKSLKHLDVSNNHLVGRIPSDFPPLQNLNFLNVSFNKFSGKFPPKYYQKFGKSSFVNAGDNFTVSTVAVTNSKIRPRHNKTLEKHILPDTTNNKKNTTQHESRKRRFKIILASSLSSVMFVILFLVTAYLVHRRTKTKKWIISKPIQQAAPYKMDKSGPLDFETQSGGRWTVEIKEAASANVVMFEKPLLSLAFKDLVAATCGFGRESQLAEGRCGPLYRAILPGDLHVAVKVMENARGVDNGEIIGMFQDLALLKHPNLLPISGYCIAGKEKLVLYEFMSNGDLHSWLHELPPGRTNVDDWSTDTWEYQNDPEATVNNNITMSPEKLNWLTRHRIALGVARGLAYLHHARSKPVVHGHLVPSNILLGDDLEPRIADFGMCLLGGSVGSVEEDVFGFGLVIIELLIGQSVNSKDLLGKVRKSVRDGTGARVLDHRLKLEDDSITRVAVECLRVGYLCTAESTSKRPTMQQVVGLLKDIRS
ncbi:hypothetical protein vseg_007317 [Gypsophila vaccaria]